MNDDLVHNLIRGVAKIEQSASDINNRLQTLEINIGALRLMLGEVPIIKNDVGHLKEDIDQLKSEKADKSDLDEIKTKMTSTEDTIRKIISRIVMGLCVAGITFVANKFGITLPKF